MLSARKAYSGCSTSVEHTPWDRNVVGLNPDRCWAYLYAQIDLEPYYGFLNKIFSKQSASIHFICLNDEDVWYFEQYFLARKLLPEPFTPCRQQNWSVLKIVSIWSINIKSSFVIDLVFNASFWTYIWKKIKKKDDFLLRFFNFNVTV